MDARADTTFSTPFHRPLLRGFALWMVVLLGIFIGLVELSAGDQSLSPERGGLILQMAAFLPFIWFFWQQMSGRLDVRRLFARSIGPFRWYHLPLILVLLMIGTYALDTLFKYGLSWLSPAYVEAAIQEEIIDTELGVFYNVWTVLLAAVVAPVMEEFVFRGLLLQRLAIKYSMHVAIVISSFAFGVLHLESWLGAAVFGLVMALLYLATANLWVPIGMHVLNNLLVVALDIYAPWDDHQSLADFRSDLIFYLIALLVLPAIIYYARRYWPPSARVLPYQRITPADP